MGSGEENATVPHPFEKGYNSTHPEPRRLLEEAGVFGLSQIFSSSNLKKTLVLIRVIGFVQSDRTGGDSSSFYNGNNLKTYKSKSVTAPILLEETNLAYLANTPVV